jgi:hypothetical protein
MMFANTALRKIFVLEWVKVDLSEQIEDIKKINVDPVLN